MTVHAVNIDAAQRAKEQRALEEALAFAADELTEESLLCYPDAMLDTGRAAQELDESWHALMSLLTMEQYEEEQSATPRGRGPIRVPSGCGRASTAVPGGRQPVRRAARPTGSAQGRLAGSTNGTAEGAGAPSDYEAISAHTKAPAPQRPTTSQSARLYQGLDAHTELFLQQAGPRLTNTPISAGSASARAAAACTARAGAVRGRPKAAEAALGSLGSPRGFVGAHPRRVRLSGVPGTGVALTRGVRSVVRGQQGSLLERVSGEVPAVYPGVEPLAKPKPAAAMRISSSSTAQPPSRYTAPAAAHVEETPTRLRFWERPKVRPAGLGAGSVAADLLNVDGHTRSCNLLPGEIRRHAIFGVCEAGGVGTSPAGDAGSAREAALEAAARSHWQQSAGLPPSLQPPVNLVAVLAATAAAAEGSAEANPCLPHPPSCAGLHSSRPWTASDPPPPRALSAAERAWGGRHLLLHDVRPATASEAGAIEAEALGVVPRPRRLPKGAVAVESARPPPQPQPPTTRPPPTAFAEPSPPADRGGGMLAAPDRVGDAAAAEPPPRPRRKKWAL